MTAKSVGQTFAIGMVLTAIVGCATSYRSHACGCGCVDYKYSAPRPLPYARYDSDTCQSHAASRNTSIEQASVNESEAEARPVE